jgi:hypothetical protein
LRKATNTSWTPLLNASPAKSRLHGLAGKSANAYLCQCKPVSAELGGPVEPSRDAALPLDQGDKVVALALDNMQHWIKAAGAEAVAMMAEFVDHPLPVDLHLCRMMQDVKPDQARQQIVEFHRSNSRFRSRYRSTLSGTDIEAKRFQ